MTRIPSPIRSARSAYRSTRYPADLAAELLPPPSVLYRYRPLAGRRRALAGGVAVGFSASAAAAALLFSLLLSRPSTIEQPRPAPSAERAGLDWLPIAPDKMPLPHFRSPALPVSPPQLRLQVPPGVDQYQHLAMHYRALQVPESLRHTTVPTIPADLPSRGVEWLQQVWRGEKSA